MARPFTERQFFEAFAAYNTAIWPAQFVLFALALLATAACFFRHTAASRRLVGGVLGLLWAFMGLIYHARYFAAVTPAAYGFAALFLAGAFVLVGRKEPLAFGNASPARLRLGAALVAYSLLIYPAIGYALGHRYPATPTLGAPCPLVIFTLGLLVTIKPPLPMSLLVASALWAFIGTTAAVQFGMFEDFGLTVAAVIVLTLAVKDRKAFRVAELAA